MADLFTLLDAISGSAGASSLVKANAGASTNQLENLAAFGAAVQPNGSNPGGTRPQAFITILFFDERFNLVESGNGVTQYQVDASVGAGGKSFDPLSAKAPKNGYVYVYLSNQSDNPVYFDEFKVGIAGGNIVEENHYYTYGLKIAAISSRKLGDINEGKLKNQYQWQGHFSEYDDETGWNDFELRSYDPQTGRFIQQDPYDQFASGYVGMGNDPLNNVDEEGGWSEGFTGAAIGAGAGFVAPYAIEGITGKQIENKALWGLGGAFLGAGIGYGMGTSLAGEGPVLMNTVAFYKGFFGGSGYIYGKYDALNKGWAYVDVPKIWGKITLSAISIGNPLQWIAASREIITETVLASIRLGQIISDPNFADGYPSYSGNIPLPPNNGSLNVRIDGGTPAGYKFNSSGAVPGSTNVKVDLTPDVRQIMSDRTESFRQYGQSGINLDDIRRQTIRDAVQENNRRNVKISEEKKELRHYKYLKIFNVKFKFIRKNP